MDNLRLILLALGVAVIAAIWAFEAWRRRRNAAARDDPFADFDSDDPAIDELPPWQEQPSVEDDEPHDAVAPRRRRQTEGRDLFEDDEDSGRDEPLLGDLPPLVAKRDDDDEVTDDVMPIVPMKPGSERVPPAVPSGDFGMDDEDITVPAAQQRAGDAAKVAPAERGEHVDAGDEPRDDDAGPSAARASGDNDAPARREASAGKVLSLIVMARPGRRFVGHQIRAALESVGLRYGEMQIFHFHDDDEDDTPLFSAVNALKPGTFDLARLGELSTTGVALFMQLPGPGDDTRVFELMLDTARHLAERLGGELGDAARRPLSAARVQELRASVAGEGGDGMT